MSPLTAQLLRNFPYDRYADAGSVQRGRVYYKDNRVDDIELVGANAAICQVMGDSDDYLVRIKTATGAGGLTFSCTCPYGEEGNFCKHMVAAGLALAGTLEGGASTTANRQQSVLPAQPPGRNWQAKLGLALSAEPRRVGGYKPVPYLAVVLLEKNDFFGYGYSGYAPGEAYKVTPYVIQPPDWGALPAGADAPMINALLESDRKWVRVLRPLTASAEPAGCLNLGAKAVAFLNVLASQSQVYYGAVRINLANCLSILAGLDLPLFLGSKRTQKIERRLWVLPEPVQVGLDLRLDPAGLSLLPVLERDGEITPIKAPAIGLTHQPAWAVLDNLVAQLAAPELLERLSAFPVKIPVAEVGVFRERYFASLAQALPLRSGLVQWHEVHTPPVPRLYLRDDKHSGLAAELRFGYGEHEVLAAKNAAPTAVVTMTDSWELARIFRNVEREAAVLDEVMGPTYGLKRSTASPGYGGLALRAKLHPFDFLLHEVPKLAQAGFEVYGADTLKIGKINRSTPRLQVTVSSGLDWFDLSLMVEFGDQQVMLSAVRKALQRGERYIKLADGSAGQIPAEWLEKYRHLWRLATETKEGLRVSDTHLPLLDTLLEDDPDLQFPPDLLERRNRLRSFEHIAAQPLPADFVGELRPYQKHGVDWLHFLHDYKFGGILADDMGLGKTVQVLAFFQLLKQHAPPAAASLLVVPKSLLTNWQRESARFTPGLRLLPHVGLGRSKEVAAFAGYDFVLTTYGTLLRDIDLLRHYRFQYVVLDESQAIKNPLSKSAKAARLLDAEHRLVMTGTPVENNTMELWSQFAFLNPGLLGSLDFFRQEFAIPIESRGDESAAGLLRKLVYPFILRRTKAQVAPELPPRTERIIYSDMDSAQKKLYARTRDRYRAELLGLIESQGMNDARFKILEGLLRLRQIAIYPGLVDSRYRGAAPKLEILLETLETLQTENHKALIFSQFVGVLNFVRRELAARELKFAYLDGKTKDRQARVDAFQNDPDCRIFLISLKAGGVGLNLTAAEYVIHLDPWWNPAVEMQASDRAHRIGQDKPVFIYKLIARDTVEEKILKLQDKKRALVNSLVTTEGAFFKSLTRDDVSALFG